MDIKIDSDGSDVDTIAVWDLGFGALELGVLRLSI